MIDLEESLASGGNVDSLVAWEDFACPETDQGAIGGRFSFGRRELRERKRMGEAFPIKQASERSWVKHIKSLLGFTDAGSTAPRYESE